MNEHVTGDPWLPLEQRRERLAANAQIIRDLHRGEWVTTHAAGVDVQDAHLYTRPARPIPLYAAAITPDGARRAAAWAQGLITVNQPEGAHRQTAQAYRDAGGLGPVMLQVHLSWAATDREATEIAMDQWRTNVFGYPLDQDLPTPGHFDAAARDVPAERVADAVWISSSVAAHTEWIQEAAEEFEALYVHHVGQDQHAWLDTAGESILPEVTS